MPGKRDLKDAQAAVAVAAKSGVVVKVAVGVLVISVSGVAVGAHVGQTGVIASAVGQISVTAGRARVASSAS